jgi:transcriptional antiterminator
MQKEIIKDHLKLVFDKQTPDYDMTITTTGHEPSDFLTPRESIIC